MLLQENVAFGALPDYVNKYYSVAVNVNCFGTAIAIITFPPLTQLLLDVYGWRGTMLFFCGVNLHTIPCGALFDTDVETDDNNKNVNRDFKTGSTYFGNENKRSTIMEKLHDLLTAFDISMLTSLAFVSRVLIPGLVFGYTYSAWMIYIVSFSISFGLSMKQASIIATSGGIGIAVIRIALPFLNSILTYRQLLYISSLIMTVAMILTTLFHSFVSLCISSVIYGISMGTLSTEIYMAIKDVTREDQYVNAVAWYHLVDGFAMITSATITGKVIQGVPFINEVRNGTSVFLHQKLNTKLTTKGACKNV